MSKVKSLGSVLAISVILATGMGWQGAASVSAAPDTAVSAAAHAVAVVTPRATVKRPAVAVAVSVAGLTATVDVDPNLKGKKYWKVSLLKRTGTARKPKWRRMQTLRTVGASEVVTFQTAPGSYRVRLHVPKSPDIYSRPFSTAFSVWTPGAPGQPGGSPDEDGPGADLAAPDTAPALSVSVDSENVHLSWSEVPRGEGYTVYYGIGAGSEPTRYLYSESAWSGSVSWTLTPEVTYRFAVTADNSAGESPPSMAVAATIRPDPYGPLTERELEVVRLTNEARKEGRWCGDRFFPAPGGPLTVDLRLAAAARKHAVDMATNGYYSHDSRSGLQFWQRITAEGYAYDFAGENIASGQWSPQSVVDAWVNSPPHCANIMSGYEQIGIGYAYFAEAGGMTIPQEDVWVQDFGLPPVILSGSLAVQIRD